MNRTADSGNLYILTVGVEPRLTAKGKRDPYAGDAWFVRQALAGMEPFHATTHSRVFWGQHATRAAVIDVLAWLGTSVGERDFVVIFFSTHGGMAPHGSGAPKEGYYIDLAGAGVSADNNSCVLWGSELNAALAAIRGRAVLLLDTCQAGGVLQGAGVTSHKATVIAACAADEISDGQREIADKPHGWFVIALCEALSGRPGDAHCEPLIVWTIALTTELNDSAMQPKRAEWNGVTCQGSILGGFVTSRQPRSLSRRDKPTLITGS